MQYLNSDEEPHAQKSRPNTIASAAWAVIRYSLSPQTLSLGQIMGTFLLS